MRVSDIMKYSSMTQSMSAAEEQVLKASQVANTGARVAAPSDDPVAAAQAARVQAGLDQTDAYRSTIRTVRSDVELSEDTLASAGTLLQNAHELALQGATGTADADSRSAMAAQIAQMKQQLIGMANQKGSQGYLFGGTATTTTPFDDTGAFSGNDDDRTAQIGNNLTMTVSTSGAKAFTAAGGRDVFADLDALQTALQNNDQAGILASVNNLDTSSRQVVAARVDAGVRLGRLDATDAAHQQTSLALTTERHNLVDADPATAYSQLAQTQNTLQQAIAVSHSLLSTLSNPNL